MRFKLTGRQMNIIITNKKIGYDWNNDKRYPHAIAVKGLCKNGYITKDPNGREIGIVFMADGNFKEMAYMLFFKEYEKELGIWRLVTHNIEKIPFSKLEEILEIQNEYTYCQIKI